MYSCVFGIRFLARFSEIAISHLNLGRSFQVENMNSDVSHTREPDIRQIDIIKIYADKKCLVIDDFPEIRGSLSRMLKTFGCNTVDTAANGEEAIKLCSVRNYDIVICDYNLGAGKDGQQVLEEVRYLRVLLMTSLFVMVTGESSREMVLGALECQPDDYITKPYTQSSLKHRLDRAIIRHQVLLPVKRHISNGDYRSALDLCNLMIDGGSRYASDCLKLKGQLHFLLQQLKQAKAVYESILSNKPLVWAKLGMGKTLKELGNYEGATQMCEEIIAEDERYIEAHDLLAEIHLEQKEFIEAQNAVARATQISPKSVLRHRKLASIAEHNRDDETALKSYQQAIKWGSNSCHESAQDYFAYARKACDMRRSNQSGDAKTLFKQANTYLERARKRYDNQPEINAQALMVETQMHAASGDKKHARAALEKTRELYKNMATPPVEVSLEFARALHAMDEEEEAHGLLARLAAKNADNKALLQIIDSITAEPISDSGKEVAAQLTREGISSYDRKIYAEAIRVFNEALANYPKHIGLHLNLVQALCADSEANGQTEQHADLCLRSIHAVGKLPAHHKQYQRYQFLMKQVNRLYPQLLNQAS